eukprot:357715-Chlamydomonas_euryale.AAC.9
MLATVRGRTAGTDRRDRKAETIVGVIDEALTTIELAVRAGTSGTMTARGAMVVPASRCHHPRQSVTHEHLQGRGSRAALTGANMDFARGHTAHGHGGGEEPWGVGNIA